MEHCPRMLLMLEHSSSNLFIGELDKYIKLISNLKDEEIRTVDDYQIDMKELKNIIEKMGDNKPKIYFKPDPNLKLINMGENIFI